MGVLLTQLFRGESATSEKNPHEISHRSRHRTHESGLAAASPQALGDQKKGTQSAKELLASESLITETNTDSDNFLKIDEVIRSGSFQSHLHEFETFCSSSRREKVVTYLLACVDGGDESVLMRMNAAALRNPSEPIRDQALISLISLTGIDFKDHEAAIKWTSVNLPQSKSLSSGK